MPALGYCAGNVPQPVTRISVAGDCNGIAGLGLSPDKLSIVTNVPRCPLVKDCVTRIPFYTAFAFRLGTWAWNPAYTTPLGTPFPLQTADPAGNMWFVSCSPPPGPTVTQTNCVWTTGGIGPTPIPQDTPTPGGPTPVASNTPVPVPTSTCTDVGFPYGHPTLVQFGECYSCNGTAMGLYNPKTNSCGPFGTPTPTKVPTVAVKTPTIGPPPATATPCVNVPGGIPGPFGMCYDCAGNPIGVQPCAVLPASPTVTPSPVKTPTAGITTTVTAVATAIVPPPRPSVTVVPFKTPIPPQPTLPAPLSPVPPQPAPTSVPNSKGGGGCSGSKSAGVLWMQGATFAAVWIARKKAK